MAQDGRRAGERAGGRARQIIRLFASAETHARNLMIAQAPARFQRRNCRGLQTEADDGRRRRRRLSTTIGANLLRVAPRPGARISLGASKISSAIEGQLHGLERAQKVAPPPPPLCCVCVSTITRKLGAVLSRARVGSSCCCRRALSARPGAHCARPHEHTLGAIEMDR